MLEAAGDLVDDSPGRRRPLQRVASGGRNAGVDGDPSEVGRPGDAQRRSARVQCADDVRRRLRAGQRVPRIRPGDHLLQQRDVGDGATDRPQASFGAVAEAAVARDAARGGEEADDAAEGRRDPRRAAAVGTDRQRHHPGGDRGGGASARGSRDAGGVPRVDRLARETRLRPRPRREFRHVGLPDDDRPGAPQPLRDGPVVRRHESLEQQRPAGGRDVFRPRLVLERDGNPVQRAERVAALHGRFRRLRVVERTFTGHRDERMQRRIQGIDTCQARGDHVHR